MNLMTSLASVEGLENTVAAMFRIVLEHVGGTNLSIHYRIDSNVYYVDLLGERKQLVRVEDPLVQRVFETGEFLEHKHDFRDTKMTTPEFTQASTWVFPLKVGPEFIGVFKIDSMHVLARDLLPYLPTFFNYAALLLKNEILGDTHLSKAYALLEREVEARARAEKDLLQAKANLEVTVEQRMAEFRHLNRLYNVLSHVNQTTVLAASREDLLTEVCRISVDLGGFHLAWIGWVHWDTLEVTPVASAGTPLDYVASLRVSVRDCPEGRGPSGSAVREGKTSVTNDFLADPRTAIWHEAAVRAGFLSSAAVPIFQGDRVAGVLCVYCAEKEMFHSKEVALLEEIAAAVTMGLGRIEAETARKRSSAALRASEKRFRVLFDNSPVPIWEEDLSDVKILLDGLKSQGIADLNAFLTEHPEVLRRCAGLVRVTEVNQAAVQLHEASSKEDLLSGLGAVFAPQSYVTFQHALLSLWSGVTPVQAEGTVQTLAGAEKHVSLYWSLVPGQEQTLSKVLVSVIDVTERRLTERQLTLLDFALDHVREAAFLTDENARFLYVNEEACRALGYTREELLQLTVSDIDRDFPQARWSSHWDDIRKRHSLTFESRHTTKDGRSYPVEISANFFTYELVSYNLALARDITVRKQLEQDHITHLRFLESMDRVNRSIQGASTLEELMVNVLDDTLSILGADRASLCYPCDPNADSWNVPIERTRPEYPGLLALGIDVPMLPEVKRTFGALLASGDPVPFGPEAAEPLPEAIAKEFSIQSQLGMAVYPKVDFPYMFVVHQCSHPRVWSREDRRLFQEVGRRLGDGLTSLLTQRNLRKSEELYRSFVAASPDGVVVVDGHGRIALASPRIYEMLRRSPDRSLTGSHVVEWVAQADKERLLTDVASVERGEIIVGAQYTLTRDDGSLLYVDISGASLGGGEGATNGIVAIVRDATARRQAEERVSRLAAIVQSSDDAIIGKSLDGVITSFNRGAENLYGYVEREAVGRAVSMLVPDEHEDDIAHILETIRSGGRVDHYETVRKRKDGALIHVSLTVSPIMDLQGSVVGASAIARDVTSHKRAENIRKARLHLLEFADSHSVEELLTATLDRIEALTGSSIGFYHFMEEDQETLTLQNWSTNTLSSMCTAEGKGSHYPVTQAGVWVDCVHERRAIIHNDYATLPHRKGMPEGHAPVIREVVVPVFRGNLITAIVGVGNKPGEYDDSDVEIVSQLADLSWDIVERKRAEEKLRRTAEEWQVTFDSIADMVSIQAADATLIRVNEAYARTFGTTPEALLGKKCFEVVHGTTCPIPQCPHQRTVHGGTATVEDVWEPNLGVYLEVSTAPIFDAKGQVTGSIHIAKNITERKKAEASLRRSEEEKTVLNTIANVFLTIPDEEMYTAVLDIVVRVTASPFGMFGYISEAGDLVLPSFTRTIWKECQVPDKSLTFPPSTWGDSLWGRCIREKTAFMSRGPFHTPGGHIAISGFLTVPIVFGQKTIGLMAVANKEGGYDDEDMEILRRIVTYIAPILNARLQRDVHERNRLEAEEEIRTLNADLEQRVRERTFQLESVNRELEAFSYSVSHDLRAPLRHLTGFVSLLLRRTPAGLDEKNLHYLNVISASAAEMGKLIDDILSFARMGRVDMTKSRVDMQELVQAVLLLFQHDLERRDIVWSVGPLPCVYGSPEMLRTVMSNLISNAIKFTSKQPHARIEIGQFSVDDSEDVFYVRDNGAGFDMNYADKLFGLFQRLHRMDEFEGTGLGLANVHRIVQRHGGRTWAEGAEGAGATFYFSLPRIVGG
ncbi:MAG: PAS domain S-box protein [Candidatus Hydrogenedentes bacterium]|nr:PAS domain S-box protein [Candidatus Hydrogenedentota bacterium]